MFCGKCGHNIPDGAKFCSNCGAPVPDPNAAEQQRAGQPVNMTEKFIAERQAQKAAQAPQSGAYYSAQGQAPQGGTYYSAQTGRQSVPGQNYALPENRTVRVSAKPQARVFGIPVGGVVGIVLVGILLLVIVCVALAVNLKKRAAAPPEKQTAAVEAVEPTGSGLPTRAAESETETGPEKTEATDAAPTTAKTAGTAAPTEPPVDVANIGDPSPEDFAWYDTNDPDAIPSGAENLTTGAEISGRWKACLFYPDAVRELAAIEIWAGDRAVSVRIDPQQINYDGYWESEADMSPWSYDGALDYDGSVTAYGDYGRIYFYTFFRYNGRQYALAAVELQSGGEGHIALVRP